MRILCLIIFLLFFYSVPLQAKGTPAGTVIQNVATLDFEIDNKKEQIKSNTVTDVVAQLLDLSLDLLSVAPAQITDTKNIPVLKFKLTNTGNGADTFALSAEYDTQFDLQPADLRIAIDTNRNNRYDPHDTALRQISLKPDEEVVIFVHAHLSEIPDTGKKNLTAKLLLHAFSMTGGSGIRGKIYPHKGVDGVDAVDGDNGGRDSAEGSWQYIYRKPIQIKQESTILDPYGNHEPVSGAIITYRILITSMSQKLIKHIQYKNPIPEHTTYKKCSIFLDKRPISDSKDGDPGEYDSKNNLIKVDIDHMKPKETKEISFKVKIK